mmetsp:Transcript_80338/g.232099  ORF Transcript_80338/g.232099 Transcript_80338/m.232099 type:complete len:213 (+) Transcript_80338:483-1121(+)
MEGLLAGLVPQVRGDPGREPGLEDRDWAAVGALEDLRLLALQQAARDERVGAEEPEARGVRLVSVEQCENAVPVERVAREPILFGALLHSATDHGQIMDAALQRVALHQDAPIPSDPVQGVEGQQQADRRLQGRDDGSDLLRRHRQPCIALLVHAPGGVPQAEDEGRGQEHAAGGVDHVRAQGRAPMQGDAEGHRQAVRPNARLLVVLPGGA